MIKHFLTEHKIPESSLKDLDKSAYFQDCLAYDWSGNVRQLENELKRLVPVLNPFDGQKLIEELSKLNKTKTEDTSQNFLFDKKAKMEKTEIREAIKRCGRNREKAAKVLGISKATLYRKIKHYNLDD